MDMTNLYLLIFPASGLIKVGKADDVHVRIQTLQRTWGAVDYAASYYLRVPKKRYSTWKRRCNVFSSNMPRHLRMAMAKQSCFPSQRCNRRSNIFDSFVQPTPRPINSSAEYLTNCFPRRKQKNAVDSVTACC